MAISVQGVEELTVILENITAKDLTKALGDAGGVVERRAKQRCPKDKGHLARNIHYEVDGNTCTIFNPLKYAPYVEYGTGLFAEQGGRKKVPWHYQDAKGEWHSSKGQPPQPYLRPALMEAREEILEILGGELVE